MQPILSPQLQKLDTLLCPLGLMRLGGFHVQVGDEIFDMTVSEPSTLVMVGNVASSNWRAFKSWYEADHSTDPDAMDHWTQLSLAPIARALGADVVFPFSGPPWHPFVSWAIRTGEIFKSPLGMGIHAKYGVFHAHRAALLFREHLNWPAEIFSHPCESCASQPCLSICPVKAFDGKSYDYMACRSYLSENPKAECWSGCVARKACPIGPHNLYEPDHAAYHMHAFVG